MRAVQRRYYVEPRVFLVLAAHHAFVLSISHVEAIIVKFRVRFLLAAPPIGLKFELDCQRGVKNLICKTSIYVPLGFLRITVGEQFAVWSYHLTVLVHGLFAGVSLYHFKSPEVFLLYLLLLHIPTIKLLRNPVLKGFSDLVSLHWELLNPEIDFFHQLL